MKKIWESMKKFFIKFWGIVLAVVSLMVWAVATALNLWHSTAHDWGAISFALAIGFIATVVFLIIVALAVASVVRLTRGSAEAALTSISGQALKKDGH